VSGTVAYRPVSVVRSEHVVPERMPIRPVYARGCRGRVEIFPEFVEGLRDLEGCSHLYLVHHVHRCGQARLVVKPFLQDVNRGIFATRAPWRPNPVVLSIVEPVRREGNVPYVDHGDIPGGTPLLDIKPFASRFDHVCPTCNGGYDEVDEETARRRERREYDG
jgi:tRNA-Thr(GGU) m(6)t(6)A37 methyltransferase TsaA